MSGTAEDRKKFEQLIRAKFCNLEASAYATFPSGNYADGMMRDLFWAYQAGLKEAGERHGWPSGSGALDWEAETKYVEELDAKSGDALVAQTPPAKDDLLERAVANHGTPANVEEWAKTLAADSVKAGEPEYGTSGGGKNG